VGDLIKVSTGIQKRNSQVSIATRALKGVSTNQAIEFLIRYPDYACHHISVNYVLNASLLREHIDKLDWDEVFRNQPFNKSHEFLLQEYENFFEFATIFGKDEFPWDEALVKEYQDKIDWGYLCQNEAMKWDESKIERYKDKIDWTRLSSCHLDWSPELFYKYASFWDFEALSMNDEFCWSVDIIHEFSDKWDWVEISCMIANSGNWGDGKQGIALTEELLDNIKKEEFWEGVCSCNQFRVEWIERYWEHIDWGALSSNHHLNWSTELLDKYINNLDWSMLSHHHKGLPWSNELIDRYIGKWDWNMLSWNDDLDWNNELIDRYFNKWSWIWLSSNRGMHWSDELIERHENKWDWKKLSDNSGIKWSERSLRKYVTKLDLSEVFYSTGRNWSISQLLKLEKCFVPQLKDEWHNGSSIFLSCLLPHLDDAAVNKILRKL